MAEEDAAVTAFAIDGENLDNIEGGFEFSQNIQQNKPGRQVHHPTVYLQKHGVRF